MKALFVSLQTLPKLLAIGIFGYGLYFIVRRVSATSDNRMNDQLFIVLLGILTIAVVIYFLAIILLSICHFFEVIVAWMAIAYINGVITLENKSKMMYLLESLDKTSWNHYAKDRDCWDAIKWPQ